MNEENPDVVTPEQIEELLEWFEDCTLKELLIAKDFVVARRQLDECSVERGH